MIQFKPLSFLFGLTFAATSALLSLPLNASIPMAYMRTNEDYSKFIKQEEEKPKEKSYLQSVISTPSVEILTKLDLFLEIVLSSRLKNYAAATAQMPKDYQPNIIQLHTINTDHGFFSKAPLVATVSDGVDDMRIGCGAMKQLYEKGDPDLIHIASSELLSKVMAYRNLQKGQMLSIPAVVNNTVKIIRYRVDHIFDLWLGMPAYGLIPVKKGNPSILLFRGTNFSFNSVSSWASIISDLDYRGPGLNVYQHSQEQIHDWLQKVASQGNKARVIGFSLGGALAVYTYLNEYPLLAQEGSVAFNPPGFSDSDVAQWEALPPAWKNGLTIYVTQGDVISKTGKLFGQVYALSTNRVMTPLRAHTLFMTGTENFQRTVVDVHQENTSGR